MIIMIKLMMIMMIKMMTIAKIQIEKIPAHSSQDPSELSGLRQVSVLCQMMPPHPHCHRHSRHHHHQYSHHHHIHNHHIHHHPRHRHLHNHHQAPSQPVFFIIFIICDVMVLAWMSTKPRSKGPLKARE